MLIQCLACSILGNCQMSVELRTVSRFNLISQDISQFSDIYVAAEHRVAGPDNFLFKNIPNMTFLNDATARFFTVTQMSDVLKNAFLLSHL